MKYKPLISLQWTLTLSALMMLGAVHVRAQDWQLVAELQQPRFRLGSVLLNDGRVLIMGGTTAHEGNSLASCEIFDYRDGSIRPTSDMISARQHFQALVLDDGRVLVAGGAASKSAGHRGVAINSVEIFDPETEVWTAAAPMPIRREAFQMLMLNDGRILAMGGLGGAPENSAWAILSDCHVYDPATDIWTAIPSMYTSRTSFTATLLDDNRVLVAGGYGPGQHRCEIYDPESNSWTEVAPFLVGGTGQHIAVPLSDGRVLRTGGWPGPQQWSEIYDPVSNEWRTTIGQMNERRYAHQAVTLPDGRVMIVGGANSSTTSLNSCESFDPVSESWENVQALPQPSAEFSLLLLPNDQTLVIGGSRLVDGKVGSLNGEIYMSNFSTVFNSAPVSGRLWRDYDANCEVGAADHGASFNMIGIEPGGHLVMTDADGNFNTLLPPGTYEAVALEQTGWSKACPDNVTEFIVASSGTPVENVDLAAQPLGAFSEMHVSLAVSRARPGFELRYVLRYQNRGTTPFSGDLVFDYPAILNYVSADLPPTEFASGRMTWSLTNVSPDFVGRIEVVFRVPPDQTLLGTQLCAELTAHEDKRQDLLLRENEVTCVEVTGSFDPNDLAVAPRGTGELGTISYDIRELAYLVRFQNTGNDTAFTVRLLDTLDRNLKAGSLRFGSSSHAYTLDVLEGGVLEFTFTDIKLPSQQENEAASQGFVKFYVSRHDEIPDGTTVQNRVSIYFDFNEPIHTNVVSSTFNNNVTDVREASSLDHASMHVFPNPAYDNTTVDLTHHEAVTALEVRDILGRLLQRVKIDAGNLLQKLDLTVFSAGMYQIVGLDSDGRTRAVGTVVVQY